MEQAYSLKPWQKAVSVALAALLATTVWGAAPVAAYAATGESGANLTYDTAVGAFGDYALMATEASASDGGIQRNQAVANAGGAKTIVSQKYLGPGSGANSSVQIAGLMGTAKPVVSTTNKDGLFGASSLSGTTLVPVEYAAVAYDENAGKFYAVKASGNDMVVDTYNTSGTRTQTIPAGEGDPQSVEVLPGFVKVIASVPNPHSRFGGMVNAAKVFSVTSNGLKAESDIVMADASGSNGTAYVKTDGTVWYQAAGTAAKQIAADANTDARIELFEVDYAKVKYPKGDNEAYITSAGAPSSKGVISAMADRILAPHGTSAQLGDAQNRLLATLEGAEFLWEGPVIVGYTPRNSQGACEFWVYSAQDGKRLQGPVQSSTQVKLERQGDNYAITYTPASGSQMIAGFYYDGNLKLISAQSAPSRLGGTLPDGRTIQVMEGTNGTISAYQVTDVNGSPITCGNYTLALGYIEGAETMGLGDATPRVQHGDKDLYCAVDGSGHFGAVNAAGDIYVPFVYDNYYDLGYLGADAPLNTSKYVMVHRDGQWFFFDVANAKEIAAPKPSEPTPAAPVRPAVKPSVADAQIIVKNKVYRGKRQYPDAITVRVDGRTLVRDRDYVVSSRGGKSIGAYKVHIRGIGEYRGSKDALFYIVPKGTKILHLRGHHRSITISWRHQPKQTDGYQVRYSLDKSFKKGVHYKYRSGRNRTMTTLTHLKPHKKYYVQVRTYKKVHGHKYFSDWSRVRAVRTR